MYTAQTHYSTGRDVRLNSRRSVKRWGRLFVYAWIGMWLSTALLPCCEVVAAGMAQEQASHPADCAHPADQAPDSGENNKTGVCLGIAAPAPAPAERLAAPTGYKLTQALSGVAISSHQLHAPPVPWLPVAYRAALPPASPYLRSSRLLI